LPIHECAFAYQKGIGIKDNARRHSSSKYLLKMDFENFFPSITPKLFFQMAESKGLEFDEKDRLILSCFLFWKKNSNSHLVLSIGAPSSPLVSNFVMSGFDEKILGECEKRKVTYTRYADDITFSTKVKDVLFSIPSVVEQNLIETVGKGIKVNMAKTVFTSKAHNRHVTGVTITNDGGLSVGRERKRLISSKIHKFSLNLLPQTEVGNLHGLLSHAAHIEPDFYIRMRNKYGTDVIDRIKRA
jgi:retron-type reverse transcriptase